MMIYRQREYFKHQRSRGIKESTLSYVTVYLEQFQRWLVEEKGLRSAHQATPSLMEAYRNYLANEYKPRRVKKLSVVSVIHQLQTIKKYFAYLVKAKYMLMDPTLNLELPQRPKILPKEVLTEEEIEALINVTEDTVIGIRDRAILEVLYSSALRRGELCALDLYDTNLKEASLHIRNSKTRKGRLVPIGKKAKEACEEYLLSSRPILLQEANEPALFLSQYGKRITTSSINYILKSCSRRLKLEKKVSPHGLRHSCATHLLKNGADIIHIQKLLGHSKLESTQIYTHLMDPELKAMIKKRHPRGREKH